MFLKAATFLAILAFATAHPHDHRHRRHLKPATGGNDTAPLEGFYGTGNRTSYHPSGSASGTIAYTSDAMAPNPIDTAAAVASNADVVPDGVLGSNMTGNADCNGRSASTTTVYTTTIQTETVNSQETAASGANSGNESDARSSEGSTLPDTATDDTTDAASTVEPPTKPSPSSALSEDAGSPTVAPVQPAVESPAEPSPSSSLPETAGSPAESLVEPAAEASAAPSLSNSPSDTPGAVPESIPSAIIPAAVTTSSQAAADVNDDSSTDAVAPAAFYELPQSGPVDTPPADTPAAPAAPAAGSSAGGKRGLAYNSPQLTKAFGGTSVSWAYNWAPDAAGDLSSGMEFVPMLWGPKAFGAWDAAAKSAVSAGAKHMLSFNEPDHGDQANMNGATAAEAHIKYMNPYAGSVKIGSPAVTSGGPTGGTDGMGLTWMQNFLDSCGGKCKMDFLVTHWYGASGDADWFKKHVQSAIDVAKKNGIGKVWITEFGVTGSNDEIAKFLGEVLPFLDSTDAVERYAFFMCSEGNLVSGNSISSPVGKAYTA
jgi:hypothetical protein